MMNSDRRRILNAIGHATMANLIVPSIAIANRNKIGSNTTKQISVKEKYSSRCIQLVENATCIDMLSTFTDEHKQKDGKSLREVWESIPHSFTQNDFEFIKSCGINVFGWGSLKPSYEEMLEFMAVQNGIVASNPDFFERIDSKEKLRNIAKLNKIGLLVTNQDSKHFKTVDDVDLFYNLGQRVSQITYNGKNRLGCGAFEDLDTGLTNYGKTIIDRMNKVGMGVDVSHCGDKTTMDAINASNKPVLITHGACRSLAKGINRAKTDQAIKAMANTGGVIGIPILRFMIREKEPVSINDFINHIDHVAQLVGVDHVGIGSDQGLYTEDYMPKNIRKQRLENAPQKYQTHTNDDYLLTIEKLNHPHRVYDISESLINRGYQDDDIKKILGNNFKRALTDIFNH